MTCANMSNETSRGAENLPSLMWVRIFRKSAFFEESFPGKGKSTFSFSLRQSAFELKEKTKESPPNHQRFPTARFPPNCMKINRTRIYDIQKASQKLASQSQRRRHHKANTVREKRTSTESNRHCTRGIEMKNAIHTEAQGFQGQSEQVRLSQMAATRRSPWVLQLLEML